MKNLIFILIVVFFFSTDKVYSQTVELKPLTVKTIDSKYKNFYFRDKKINVDKIQYIVNNIEARNSFLKKFVIQLYTSEVKEVNNVKKMRYYINLDTLEELKYFQDIFENKSYSRVDLAMKSLFINPKGLGTLIERVYIEM